jgi:DNA segregation ATPase FtsK/SpoIIIE, S-DNA-T family
VITIAQLWRLLITVIAFILRHPLADTIVLASFASWHFLGWPGLAGLVVIVVAVLAAWRWRWPESFSRFIARPALEKWRRWHYQRHWAGVMTISRLAPMYQGRILLPVLGNVSSTLYTDRVQVRLVSGQCTADFANRAENLAHGFGALLCRVRTGRPSALVLELVRKDALGTPFPALPLPAQVDLRALPVGRREDGAPGWSSCMAPIC